MKHWLFCIIIGLIVALQADAREGRRGENDTYKRLMELYSDSTAYALVNLGGEEVLLVSHMTYIDEMENHQPFLAAIGMMIYGLDNEGGLVCYGEVSSQGTLYALAMRDGCLIAAGHHYVHKYVIAGRPKTLQLVETMDVNYDGKGKPTSRYEDRLHEICRTTNDEHDDETMIKSYLCAEKVVFRMKGKP